MDENNTTKADRRIDDRNPPEQYHSVQFTTKGLNMAYQSKLWDISKKGMCILVRQDSIVMSHLKVGDILDMEYYSEKGKGHTDQAKTEIKHITKNEQGRFKGHYLVGLSIIEA